MASLTKGFLDRGNSYTFKEDPSNAFVARSLKVRASLFINGSCLIVDAKTRKVDNRNVETQ